MNNNTENVSNQNENIESLLNEILKNANKNNKREQNLNFTNKNTNVNTNVNTNNKKNTYLDILNMNASVNKEPNLSNFLNTNNNKNINTNLGKNVNRNINKNINKNIIENINLEDVVNRFKTDVNTNKLEDTEETRRFLNKLIGRLVDLKKSKNINQNTMTKKLNQIMSDYQQFASKTGLSNVYNKNTSQPLINLAERIKETSEIESNRKKLYNDIGRLREEKKLSLQKARNVVKKLYNYIIAVNESFNVPREERITYINDLVEKLNSDEEFLRNLNTLLMNDNRNMLDEPLDVSANSINNVENRISIKDRLDSFQKVSRQNANNTLKEYLQRNVSVMTNVGTGTNNVNSNLGANAGTNTGTNVGTNIGNGTNTNKNKNKSSNNNNNASLLAKLFS